ncbi:MAG: hypothetical protein AB7U05_11510 [Mangrovibacterium sp.]
MEIGNLSTQQKKDLALKLAKELKPDQEVRQALLDELQRIDSNSADSDIKAWADPKANK